MTSHNSSHQRHEAQPCTKAPVLCLTKYETKSEYTAKKDDAERRRVGPLLLLLLLLLVVPLCKPSGRRWILNMVPYVDGVGVFLTVAADAGRECVTGSVSFELEELGRKTGWRWVWRSVRTSAMAPADSMEWMRKVCFKGTHWFGPGRAGSP